LSQWIWEDAATAEMPLTVGIAASLMADGICCLNESVRMRQPLNESELFTTKHAEMRKKK